MTAILKQYAKNHTRIKSEEQNAIVFQEASQNWLITFSTDAVELQQLINHPATSDGQYVYTMISRNTLDLKIGFIVSQGKRVIIAREEDNDLPAKSMIIDSYGNQCGNDDYNCYLPTNFRYYYLNGPILAIEDIKATNFLGNKLAEHSRQLPAKLKSASLRKASKQLDQAINCYFNRAARLERRDTFSCIKLADAYNQVAWFKARINLLTTKVENHDA
jgi:hypothetical protein